MEVGIGRKIGKFEEPGEGAVSKARGVDEIADLVCEDETARTVEGASRSISSSWRERWARRVLAHRRVFAPAVSSGGLPSPSAPVRALLGRQAIRDLPARIMAFGIWPVHVDR